MIKYIEITADGQKGRCKIDMDINTFIDVFLSKHLGKFVDITQEEYESHRKYCLNRRFETEDGNNIILMEFYLLD